MKDTEDIGQGRTYPDASEKQKATEGTYDDPVQQVPTDQRLPTTQMPQAPDPQPFTLGPQAPGGR